MEEGFSWGTELSYALSNLSQVEIFAVCTGLIYVILAVKEIIWCWLFGIISSMLSIYLFYTDQLFAESILYVYYVFAGVYGWWAWSKKNASQSVIQTQDKIKIHSWSFLNHGVTIITGGLLALILAYVLKNYTTAQIPLLDSFTTVFSFIATYMVTRKVLENWVYWIIIDLVTTGMYFYREFYLYSLLMIIYTIIAVVGYLNWRKLKGKDMEQSRIT